MSGMSDEEFRERFGDSNRNRQQHNDLRRWHADDGIRAAERLAYAGVAREEFLNRKRKRGEKLDPVENAAIAKEHYEAHIDWVVSTAPLFCCAQKLCDFQEEETHETQVRESGLFNSEIEGLRRKLRGKES